MQHELGFTMTYDEISDDGSADVQISGSNHNEMCLYATEAKRIIANQGDRSRTRAM